MVEDLTIMIHSILQLRKLNLKDIVTLLKVTHKQCNKD